MFNLISGIGCLIAGLFCLSVGIYTVDIGLLCLSVLDFVFFGINFYIYLSMYQ